MSDEINIEGLEKAEVLAALYNRARPQGMGFLHYHPAPMDVHVAVELLENTERFDYLYGRVMKVDLSSDVVYVVNYDRDNGQGAAAEAVASVRITGDINSDSIREGHRAGLEKAISEGREQGMPEFLFERFARS